MPAAAALATGLRTLRLPAAVATGHERDRIAAIVRQVVRTPGEVGAAPLSRLPPARLARAAHVDVLVLVQLSLAASDSPRHENSACIDDATSSIGKASHGGGSAR